MDRRELFLAVCADLEALSTSADEFQVMRIALLLRQLFLDDYPLVDQVNTRPRVRLRFAVASAKPRAVLYWFAGDGFDPATAPPGEERRRVVDRDGFLRTPVMVVNHTVYTVKGLIGYVAHVHGAVHAGGPRTPEEANVALTRLRLRAQIGDMEGCVYQLQPLARVALKALQPLREALAEPAAE